MKQVRVPGIQAGVLDKEGHARSQGITVNICVLVNVESIMYLH